MRSYRARGIWPSGRRPAWCSSARPTARCGPSRTGTRTGWPTR
jgi:hypothetical protein